MSASDDYPRLHDFAHRPSGRDPHLIASRREAAHALRELDQLRADLQYARNLLGNATGAIVPPPRSTNSPANATPSAPRLTGCAPSC